MTNNSVQATIQASLGITSYVKEQELFRGESPVWGVGIEIYFKHEGNEWGVDSIEFSSSENPPSVSDVTEMVIKNLALAYDDVVFDRSTIEEFVERTLEKAVSVQSTLPKDVPESTRKTAINHLVNLKS